ncbi:hypothetical protein BDM02DRAFT_3117385 [Thelephora ganbajun]|uniref:Uncharacterized protein n=1 Tax=Thelephora ganbajun TaxID=370292 RepID=A0ACB6ZCJ2_THEGA|nr:hypothetical protein BDM02DRAFT_3117385 [Thelephora ganbajun]
MYCYGLREGRHQPTSISLSSSIHISPYQSASTDFLLSWLRLVSASGFVGLQ